MARDDDKLSAAKRRLVNLWKKMSSGERKKATPRVRGAAEKATEKAESFEGALEDREYQEKDWA